MNERPVLCIQNFEKATFLNQNEIYWSNRSNDNFMYDMKWCSERENWESVTLIISACEIKFDPFSSHCDCNIAGYLTCNLANYKKFDTTTPTGCKLVCFIELCHATFEIDSTRMYTTNMAHHVAGSRWIHYWGYPCLWAHYRTWVGGVHTVLSWDHFGSSMKDPHSLFWWEHQSPQSSLRISQTRPPPESIKSHTKIL